MKRSFVVVYLPNHKILERGKAYQDEDPQIIQKEIGSNTLG